MKKEFKAKLINGKLVIYATSETIEYPDGTKDVIVHVPSLKMISEFAKKQKSKEEE